MRSICSVVIIAFSSAFLPLSKAGDLLTESRAATMHSKVNVQDGMGADALASPNILDTTTAEYVFGRTISRRTMAVQVHVENMSKEYDLLIHEISLEVCKGGAVPIVRVKERH